jgi:hypothetical protein
MQRRIASRLIAHLPRTLPQARTRSRSGRETPCLGSLFFPFYQAHTGRFPPRADPKMADRPCDRSTGWANWVSDGTRRALRATRRPIQIA